MIFQHVPQARNTLADWLCNILPMAGRSVDMMDALVAAKVESFSEPPFLSGLGLAPLASVRDTDLSIVSGILAGTGYTISECIEVAAVVIGQRAKLVDITCSH